VVEAEIRAQVLLGTVLLVLAPLVGMLALPPLFPSLVRLVWTQPLRYLEKHGTNTTPFHPSIANLRDEVDGRFHNEFRSVCNSEQISFWTAAKRRMREWSTYFNVSYCERTSDHILYHVLLANMLPAL